MLYGNRNNKHDVFIFSLIIILICAIAVITYINRNGFYPWGSDTFGHLFKGQLLFDTLKNNNLFLNYSETWYNGFQPFRYWAPLPYYILAILNFISDNIIFTFNLLIFLVFIVGAVGWLLYGYYLNRIWISLIIGLLWFFVPNNLRILFSEGNVPYVIINTLLPYIFLFLHKALKENNIKNYIVLSLLLALSTLVHAMLCAMISISIFFYLVFDFILNKDFRKNFIVLTYCFLGILLASFWLYSSTQGGLLSLDKNAVSSVMESQLYNMSVSLNPFLRLQDKEIYYFGLSFTLLAIFGILFKNKKEKTGVYVALLILLGTSKFAFPFLTVFPLNQFLWMNRFTSIAMAFILSSFLTYSYLRKELIIFWIIILSLDCFISAKVLTSSRTFPSDIAKELDIGLRVVSQRIALLDNSTFGSFPSYYLKYNSINKKGSQVYGWSWQGAGTSKNIVMLNTSLEKNYFNYLFDRSLELGADTLIIKKSFINDFEKLYTSAEIIGYKVVEENKYTITFKYPVDFSFGTSNEYHGIAIGKYAGNITYIFPKLYLGNSEYLDDYSFEKLQNEKLIFLSGYKYKDKNKAEDLLLKLSRNNIKVILDIAGAEKNTLFDVIPQEIIVNSRFEEFSYKSKQLTLTQFPQNLSSWKTNFINVTRDKSNYAVINNKLINYLLKKDNDNLTFLALNLPYYSFLTKDENAISILEDLFDMKAFEIPRRNIVRTHIDLKEKNLFISCEKSNTIVPIALIDGFKNVYGDFKNFNNLILTNSKDLSFKIIYPYFYIGIIMSVIAVIFLVALSLLINSEDKKNE